MKRRLFWAMTVVLILAAILFEPTAVVRGWLRGESFYQGRPTTYWSNEFRQWQCQWCGMDHEGPLTVPSTHHFVSTRQPSFFQKILNLNQPDWPSLLDGDAEGLPVLQELLQDSSLHVRKLAQVGIERITSGEKGTFITWSSNGFWLNWEETH